MLLRCKSADLEKDWFQAGTRVVSLQSTLTLRVVLMSLKTHEPIRTSTWPCQSLEEEVFPVPKAEISSL